VDLLYSKGEQQYKGKVQSFETQKSSSSRSGVNLLQKQNEMIEGMKIITGQ
jgi:hypothetical protein